VAGEDRELRGVGVELEKGWCEVCEEVGDKGSVVVGTFVHEQVIEARGCVGGVWWGWEGGEEVRVSMVVAFVGGNGLAVGGVYPVLEVCMKVEGSSGGEAAGENDRREGVCVWLISGCSGRGEGMVCVLVWVKWRLVWGWGSEGGEVGKV